MQNIGIITKRSDPRALKATQELAKWLNDNQRRVTVTSETAESANIPLSIAHRQEQENIADGQDLITVIGGDGTFLAAFRAVGNKDIPLLGINMGRLGFLTEVPYQAMIPTMTEVLAGHYRTEMRMLLSVSVYRSGKEVLSHSVMNDMVLHKGELARMMEYQVSIDSQFVFSGRADGLIMATPTGSTAYALSAGGPIIHPAVDAILLVPICPHTLTNRPIAVPGKGTITISLAQENMDRLLTLDGQTGFHLINEDQILVQRSSHQLKILHAPDRNYYSVLREKLRWGEQVGNA